jgi:serine protease
VLPRKNRALQRCALALSVSIALFGHVHASGPGASRDDDSSRINISALDGPYEYDRFIVQFREGSAERSQSQVRQQVFGGVGRSLGLRVAEVRRLAVGAELIEVDRKLPRAASEALMRALAGHPSVEYVEPDARMTIAWTPNDTHYNAQWHYHEATGGLRLPAAWDRSRGDGVRVAVLDTGITPHSDLDANIVGGYDFISSSWTARDGNGRDSNPRDEGDWVAANECYSGSPASNSSWHGTHVAGTVAAVTHNSKGVAGVAPQAKVVPIRVLGRCGGSLSDITDAIIWASGGSVSGVPANANPAEVINLSLGGDGSCGSTYQNAINSAVNRGSVVVVAAGNDGVNVSNARPANCNNVIAVAATSRAGGRAWYSNFGTLIDVAAPGGDASSTAANGVASTVNNGTTTPTTEGYGYQSGTSMAAPHVAGVVALMQAVNAKSPAEVEQILKNTARAFPASCSGCGSGIVDANAAVAAVEPPAALQNGQPIGNLSGATGSERRWTVAIPAGATNLQIAISGGSGDADLYVRRGAEPTTSTYDCRPYLNGNNETCSFASPQSGTWHVMIRGYAAYSGLTLQASWTEPVSAPCTGCTKYSGSLSGTGQSQVQPNGTYYQSTVSGAHQGWLEGPSNADFDLELYRWSGSSWVRVASSTGSTSSEHISYNGTAGYYYWRVLSYSGSGSYDLWIKRP